MAMKRVLGLGCLNPKPKTLNPKPNSCVSSDGDEMRVGCVSAVECVRLMACRLMAMKSASSDGDFQNHLLI